MNLSPVVAEWATAYEQEHGQRPAELSLRIAEQITEVRKILWGLGKKAAGNGEILCSTDTFTELVIKVLPMDLNERHSETVQAIADLWQSAYTDGCNATMKTQ